MENPIRMDEMKGSQLRNVANGMQSGRFQLPKAAISVENRHGPEF